MTAPSTLRAASVFLLYLFAAAALPAEVLQSQHSRSRTTLIQVDDRFELLLGDQTEALGLPRALVARGVYELSEGVLVTGSLSRLEGETLGLWRYREGRLSPIATPPSSSKYRNWPTLQVVDGRLRSMAWLEGGDYGDLSVRAARWDGDDWSQPVAISAPGPGTQIALRSASLADGSWLLVWSAFDGVDDEIVWSRRDSDGWSAPTPLDVDNEVPDIVPAVAASGDGAVAAWARFDGDDYRLRLAGFDGDRWTMHGWRGEKGSAFPTATAFDGGVQFLYRSALPEGWGVVEIGGGVVRSGHVASELEARPELLWGEEGPLLRWNAPHDRLLPVIWSD